jgi:DNA-binding NarL/FixJ family response regulator
MTTIRVVLAEDHATVRAAIRKFLDDAPGIEVVGEARNGIETLRLVEELTPDILLLDIEMPQMTGIDVARRLQAVESSVAILVLSAYNDWPYIQSLLDIGVAGFLTKTEPPEVIIKAVQSIARGERYWPGQGFAP